MTSRSNLLVIMTIIFFLLSLSGNEIGKYAFMICAAVTTSASLIINAIRDELNKNKNK